MEYGRAMEGPVLSKSMQELPLPKPEVRALALMVKKVVGEVNSLGKEELEKQYRVYAEEFREADARKAEASSRHNFSINGASSGNFTTRFPPEPAGYMHVGHAKPLFIEDELRKAYSGKLMLYFDDTNPDKERQEFVDAFKKDFLWLGIKFDGEYYASDSIPVLYEYASKAISAAKAYVCSCSPDSISSDRAAGKGCIHKAQDPNTNSRLWKKMLDGDFGDNEAILRFNADMSAANTTLRDPTLFRIKRAEHYRQARRFIVWPTYDFCTPIVDSLNGVTDVIRSKEYEMRDELYFAVLDSLGLRKPRITSISRLKITNNLTAKRKIRQLIQEGKVEGWDDPRLVTISGLRKRGVRPSAIREFSLSSGMGTSESVVEIGKLLGCNRKLVEPQALPLRYSYSPAPGYTECKLMLIGDLMNGEEFNDNSLTLRTVYVEESAKQLKEGSIIKLKGIGLFNLYDATGMGFYSL